MKKKLTALLLSLLCVLSVLPAAAAVGAPDTEPPAETVESTQPALTDTTIETAAEEASAPDLPAPELAALADPEPATEPVTEPPTQPATEPPVVNPTICVSSVTPAKNGVTVKWNAYEGAAKYAVYVKKPGADLAIAGYSTTTSLNYTLSANGAAIIYYVRAIGVNGMFLTARDDVGFTFSLLPAPALTGVSNGPTGQKFTWKAVNGAVCYRVFAKKNKNSEWKTIGYSTGTSFLNKSAANGSFYTYTVRCWDNTNRKYLSYFVSDGISGTFISAPKITSFSVGNACVTLRFTTVKGISRYRVYLKTSSSWKKLADTTSPSYTHKGLQTGLYTYAVRCLNKNGKAISGYYTTGNSFRYLNAPKLKSVSNGVITVNAVKYASGYRIYRKQYGKSWTVIGDTNTTVFTDTTAKNNIPYTYTARCLNSTGIMLSYYTADNKYYINGKLADGTYTVDGKTLIFVNGVYRMKGYVTVGGKMYYYNSKGVLQKNGLVGTYEEGYRYADKNGVIVPKYTGIAKRGSTLWYLKNGKINYSLRQAVTSGGVDYNVIGGKAYRVKTAEERTLFRAIKLANRVASTDLSKETRLKKLWDYIKGAYVEKNPRIPDYTGMDWPIIYADDLLVNGVGNCLSYGAEFAFLAKAIGYDNVYACHSGGHGWAEINGLVYDPEWSMHHFTYNYYGLSYNTKTDQDYKGAIGAGYAWMHIKICPHLK